MRTQIVFDIHHNSLNTIRLLAAFQVLYGHSITHLGLTQIPILGQFINFFYGVPIFFTMSGFLIWDSIGRSANYSHYIKKRFWRIYPELWVAVIIEMGVIICLYKQPIDWAMFSLFGVAQGTVFQFWTPEFLRGYGCGTPNGALWTICVLVQFYVFAYFIFKFLHNKKLWIWGCAVAVSLLVGLFSKYARMMLPEVLSKLYNQTLLPYLWMFIAASFVAEKRDYILPLLKRDWWFYLSIVIILNHFSFDLIVGKYPIIESVFLFCGLTGFSYAFPKLNIKTDISYGIYIYHMTVINALLTLGLTHNNWLLLGVFLLTCLLAFISTETVGKWSRCRKKSSI